MHILQRRQLWLRPRPDVSFTRTLQSLSGKRQRLPTKFLTPKQDGAYSLASGSSNQPGDAVARRGSEGRHEDPIVVADGAVVMV